MNEQPQAPQRDAAGLLPLSRLVLTGFMGAGKTTVGSLLAQALQWPFLDLDAVIEGRSGLSIAEIFKVHGEVSFREHERDAVKHLSDREQLVLALGGGTLEDSASRSLLLHAPGTCLVFLEADFSELLDRCGAGSKVRPLLAHPETVKERFAQRLPFYRQAHLTVPTAGLAPQEVANQVLALVSARWMLGETRKVVAHGNS